MHMPSLVMGSLIPRLLPCRKTGLLPVFLQGRSLGTRLGELTTGGLPLDSNLTQGALVSTFIWMATYTGTGEEGRGGGFGGGRVPV